MGGPQDLAKTTGRDGAMAVGERVESTCKQFIAEAAKARFDVQTTFAVFGATRRTIAK